MKRGKKYKQPNRKQNSKVLDLNPTVSVTTINKNTLKVQLGNFLGGQCLGLSAPTAEGLCNPWSGNQGPISHAAWLKEGEKETVVMLVNERAARETGASTFKPYF